MAKAAATQTVTEARPTNVTETGAKTEAETETETETETQAEIGQVQKQSDRDRAIEAQGDKEPAEPVTPFGHTGLVQR